MVRYADRFKAGEEGRLVQSHDVYPTILQLAGVEWKRVPGQTCRSLLEPPSEVADRHQRISDVRHGPLGADLPQTRRSTCRVSPDGSGRFSATT